MADILTALPLSGDQQSVAVPGTKDTVLHLTIDPAEHARRSAAGLRGITNWSVLDVLMNLPPGCEVPIGALSWRDRSLLRKLRPGIAEVTRTHVTRLAVRPCRIHRAVVSGAPTRRNLERAGRFAPKCARTLLVPYAPKKAELLVEAGFYGIGVTVAHPGGEHEVLVAERPWVPKRHTVAGWASVEQAYGWAVDHA